MYFERIHWGARHAIAQRSNISHLRIELVEQHILHSCFTQSLQARQSMSYKHLQFFLTRIHHHHYYFSHSLCISLILCMHICIARRISREHCTGSVSVNETVTERWGGEYFLVWGGGESKLQGYVERGMEISDTSLLSFDVDVCCTRTCRTPFHVMVSRHSSLIAILGISWGTNL